MMRFSPRHVVSAFHYGWLIMGLGTLCLFASLGLGRFSLGMVLPSMGDALSFTYAEMGGLSTANFVGYLVAVLVCGFFIRHFGSRKTIALSLLAIGISMLAIGMSSSFPLIVALYIVTGVGSGLANVSMIALVSIWFVPRMRGKVTGFVIIGNGLPFCSVAGWCR